MVTKVSDVTGEALRPSLAPEQDPKKDVSELKPAQANTVPTESEISNMSTSELEKKKILLDTASKSWFNWAQSWLVTTPEQIAYEKIIQELQARGTLKAVLNEAAFEPEQGFPSEVNKMEMLQKIVRAPKRYQTANDWIKQIKSVIDSNLLLLSDRTRDPKYHHKVLVERLKKLVGIIQSVNQTYWKILDNHREFSILGFNIDEKIPTYGDVEKRYRELVLQDHPDKGGNLEKFKKIQTAAEACKKVLKDNIGTLPASSPQEAVPNKPQNRISIAID